MNVPLDRLYDYLDSVCNHDILIYGFFPHGSKNLDHLSPIKKYNDWYELMSKPIMICHDQEPLNYDLYSPQDFQAVERLRTRSKVVNEHMDNMHLRGLTLLPYNSFEKTLLLHSEINSDQLLKYQQHGYVGVYWWSHAMIARDWYRYACHDADLQRTNITKDFLIYNRAWSGTREYRLKFVNFIVDADIVDHCQIKFNPNDHGHYSNHQWANTNLQINRYDFENFFEINDSSAAASADYVTQDYVNCGIEVVLETLFDDSRIQLTEKILRPIACGCPFILASTAGSLKVLRKYGFETFGEYINESYDDIVDPVLRLQAIVDEMHRIAKLDAESKKTLFANLRYIAARNKVLFFSQSWIQAIKQEFVDNLNQALQTVWPSRTAALWKLLRSEITNDFYYDPNGSVTYTPGSRERLLDWLNCPVDVLQISS